MIQSSHNQIQSRYAPQNPDNSRIYQTSINYLQLGQYLEIDTDINRLKQRLELSF
jgi:hypothetical protein